MSLNKEFPRSPFEILKPEVRWRPEDDTKSVLLPPLVPKIRRAVHEWREREYAGASETSRALLRWWFYREHTNSDGNEFRYYFAQREAVESVIYLYEVAHAHTRGGMRAFENYELSDQQFPEDWPRYVLKMATGSGKTRVLTLVITWAYFHKLYEEGSELSKNFLIIAPNIIVLDRLMHDFKGLKIFFDDPLLPDNGYADKNWCDDFQVDVHRQDNARVNRAKGNIFLTNIHRVYQGEDKFPSADDENTEDYFLGTKAQDAKKDDTDLGALVRDIDGLLVLNDEAHHIRDNKWAEVLRDLHNHLVQKNKKLSLQIDVTATPKFEKGQVFPQTVCDYPLVEAIYQRIVKHPLLPDGTSRPQERDSIDFVERYEDFIKIGVAEWLRQCEVYRNTGKRPLLFVMVDDTKNCDKVAEYLENNFKELRDAVLSIHTDKKGEITESKGNKNELDDLRKAANKLDDPGSPYKAIVSVMMLKEGWDVKNVTTIVGLRAFGSEDSILAEQTLGRGLRRMDMNMEDESVSVIGTQNFLDFIETIRQQGVEFDKKKMGVADDQYDRILIDVDRDNIKKDIPRLDIELPILTPRIYRAHDKLEELDSSQVITPEERLDIEQYNDDELKEIIFERVYPADDEEREHHRLQFDAYGHIDITNIVRWFVRGIKIELRLGSVEHILYPKLRLFIEEYLFTEKVDTDERNILKNLSRVEVKNIIFTNFKKAINEKTVLEKNAVEVKRWIKVSETDPFHVLHQSSFVPEKSLFNRIIGDSQLELDVAEFLDTSHDVVSFAKNYRAVHFPLDYQNADGEISNYIPDFFVKTDNKTVYIVETKGLETLNDYRKFNRLCNWCADVNAIQNKYVYIPLYVKAGDFEKYRKDLHSFSDLIKIGRSDKFAEK